MGTVNPLSRTLLYYFTLTPDNFTCQGESADAWVSKGKLLIKGQSKKKLKVYAVPYLFLIYINDESIRFLGEN
jgi:hypothetical protein